VDGPRDAPPTLDQASSGNLISNPGCETQGAVGGAPPSWALVTGPGSWACTTQPGTQLAHSGGFYYYAGYYHLGSLYGEIKQDIDLHGFSAAIDGEVSQLVFSFWGSSYGVGNDPSQAIVEAWGEGMTPLLDSRSVAFSHGRAWLQLQTSLPLPKGTRWARVRLTCVNAQGGDCDGYFDDLQLTLQPRPSAALGPGAAPLKAGRASVSAPPRGAGRGYRGGLRRVARGTGSACGSAS